MADLRPPLDIYALWFMTAKNEHERLQELIDKLAEDFEAQAFEAHATLQGLRGRKQLDLDEVKRSAKQLADEAAPFTVEIMGVGIREMYFQSVFLPVVPAKEMVEINAKARQIFERESDPPFMPHFSAIYGEFDTAMKAKAAQVIMKSIEFPMLVPIESIAVVDASGYPPDWKIVECYKL